MWNHLLCQLPSRLGPPATALTTSHCLDHPSPPATTLWYCISLQGEKEEEEQKTKAKHVEKNPEWPLAQHRRWMTLACTTWKNTEPMHPVGNYRSHWNTTTQPLHS
ncbi:uncharacterized protein AAES06_015649 [Glossophaga mutica]